MAAPFCQGSLGGGWVLCLAWMKGKLAELLRDCSNLCSVGPGVRLGWEWFVLSQLCE